MKLTGEFVLTGIAERPGFKDKSQINYLAAFADGVDSIRLYVDREMYDRLFAVTPYTKLRCEFEFNPAAQSVSFAMRLRDFDLV